jgi:hypothetical protein
MRTPGRETRSSGAVPSLRFFINYRHEDSWGTAAHLYTNLAQRFGADNVFYDNATLRYGEDWASEIRANVDGTAVFIALIGPAWRSILGDRAHRRGGDYVVKEIERALQTARVTVVPLQVDGAALPNAEELPETVWPLLELEKIHIRHTDLLDESATERLVSRLTGLATRGG